MCTSVCFVAISFAIACLIAFTAYAQGSEDTAPADEEEQQPDLSEYSKKVID